ncbi:MAG: InlB B-repeat-containing protein [Lachnospiraceae bacterium]|nr:InlB B-repeat-containing protein [Lachnospiraceae bacterium]
MKKTISLLLAIVLSLSVFVSNIAGISMVVRAEENTEAVENTDGGEGSDWTEADEAAWNELLQAAAEEEAAREAAYEEAAREAEEAQKQAEADAAAQEAQRQAEEQAQRAAEEAAAAEAAAAEQKKAEEDQKYSLSCDLLDGRRTTNLNFGNAQVGAERDYIPIDITNTGNTEVDLIYTKTNDGGAFDLTLHGDRTHLAPGEASRYNVSMKSNLGVGTYTAVFYFADSNRDMNYQKALAVTVTGNVLPKEAKVTKVSVSPAQATLAVGNDYKFYANVSGTGDFVSDVRWSVAGNRSTGTKITSDGTLSIASDETSGSINVIATSVSDGSISASSLVTPQRNSYNVSVKVDPANSGVVSGGGAVSQGGSVTVSAAPSNNYYFVGWIIDGKNVSTSSNYTLSNIQSNQTVTAKFAQRYVNVSVSANNGDAGNVVGGGTITYGGTTTISAKAYNGYVFTGWKEGDYIVSKDASIKLSNLTVDRKFTAMFEKTSHTITLAAYPKEGGSVTGGGTFQLGQGTTLKATAANGYTFQGWQVNNQYVSRDANFKVDKVDQDCTCTAVFTKNSVTTFEISSGVATTGGSISPAGKSLVAQGQNLTYTITPKSGFAILAVAVDGVQVGAVNTYTFTNVQGPHTISAAFLQTDAGKAANTASGKTNQSQKVEPVKKTETNTASTQSTVSLSEAASGDSGDEFVEEMNLEGIEVPTDEQLGVVSVEEVEVYSEVTQMLGKTMDEVSTMVASGNTMDILDAAFYTGGLGAYVQNAYEPSYMTSIDYQNMSRDELMQASDDNINPSLPDLDVVVQKMLTYDDVMQLAKGGHVDISVSLSGQDEPDAATKRIMKNAVGQKPVQYFDLTMLKTSDGYTEKVTELPTTMEVVIQIPDAVYSNGKTYSVLRVHNGELSVLPDLDDNPNTITFRTDRFSSYAIAQEVATAKGIVTWLIAGAALAFGVAVTCFLILIAHQRKMRQLKRQRAHK